MIDNPSIGNIRNLLIPDRISGRALALRAGAVIKAQVMEINSKGDAVLRLAPNSSSDNPQGTTIRASSEVPLTKGQNIYLEILGSRGNIRMRFMGNEADGMQKNIPAKFLDMLSQLTNARLENGEFQKLVNMLKSLPQSVRDAVPELRNLEKMLLDIKQIDGKLLKAFIETSGSAFETRLKIAVLGDPASLLQNLAALQTEGDLKGLLLRLRKLLKDRSFINALKQSGLKMSDISGAVERFINTIEFYQLTSRLNDMFCTFLPVMWGDLKDGEFLFKKSRRGGKESHTCDINLDLESLGKISISVTIVDKAFYVTFATERKGVVDLFNTHKHTLKDRFTALGLPLQAININHKKKITFGRMQGRGVNVNI